MGQNGAGEGCSGHRELLNALWENEIKKKKMESEWLRMCSSLALSMVTLS